MTKKDYIIIATALKNVKYSLYNRPENEFKSGQLYCLNYIIDELSNALYKQNNSFNDKKFRDFIEK